MMAQVEDILKDKLPNRPQKWKKVGDDLLQKWKIVIPGPLTENNPKRVDKSVAISNLKTRLTQQEVRLTIKGYSIWNPEGGRGEPPPKKKKKMKRKMYGGGLPKTIWIPWIPMNPLRECILYPGKLSSTRYMLRMYCIDTEAIAFMFNEGSSCGSTIHPIDTKICVVYLKGSILV